MRQLISNSSRLIEPETAGKFGGNLKILTSRGNQFLLLLLLFNICTCVNSNRNPHVTNKTVNTEAIEDDDVSVIKDFAYYKSKGYQVFPEFDFAVNCPAVLKSVARQSNNDYDFNYAGVQNENSKTKIVFYQVIIIKLPAGHKDMEKGEIEKMIKNYFDTLGVGKNVLWGDENYPAFVADYTHNGYTGRGISVFVKDKIFSFTVITNDDLNSKFNYFTNNVVFFNNTQDSPVINISNNATTKANNTIQTSSVGSTYNNKQKRFSIDYPNGWEIVENQMQNVQFVSFLAPEDGMNFRTNYNVIVSNRTETVDALFQMTQKQNSSHFPAYKLENKEYVSINGIRGIKQTASYGLNGYSVKGIQYILKNADNTVYSITFTVEDKSYQKDKNLLENIIQSFKSL